MHIGCARMRGGCAARGAVLRAVSYARAPEAERAGRAWQQGNGARARLWVRVGAQHERSSGDARLDWSVTVFGAGAVGVETRAVTV